MRVNKCSSCISCAGHGDGAFYTCANKNTDRFGSLVGGIVERGVAYGGARMSPRMEYAEACELYEWKWRSVAKEPTKEQADD